MRHRVSTLVLALLLMIGFMLIPGTAEAQVCEPVTGVVPDVDPLTPGNQPGTFVGQFCVTAFRTVGGVVFAVGTLTGVVRDAAGNIVRQISEIIRLPLTGATGTCEILHLELGPLELDILGLVINLNRVVLDITAESGPGNLLGNLLCAVAGLLDGGASPNALVRLLNQILGLLG